MAVNVSQMEDSEQLQLEEKEANADVTNIQKDVAIITVLNSRALQLKAVAYERQFSANLQPDAAETIKKLEEELSRTLIHRKFAKTCLQSAALHLLLKQKTKTSETVMLLLKQYGDLLQQLRNIEIRQVKLDVIKKKSEYVDKLNAFKRMLEEQKRQQQLSKQHRESVSIKETALKKLEKINIMRMLMLNIICSSNINYEENPQYSEMASHLLEPITIKSITVRLTE